MGAMWMKRISGLGWGWAAGSVRMGKLVRVCVIAIAAGVLWCGEARGQGSMAFSFASESSFQPTLTQADLNVFIRVLKLKPEEVDALEALYEGYADTVRREGKVVREQMYEAIDEAEMYVDPGKLTPMQNSIQEWGKRSEKLREQLLEDIKAFLNREQEGRWPIVERELRRMRMAGGRLTGEDLDVVKLVSGLKVDPLPPDVEEALERYSLDLDRMLIQRKSFIQENDSKFHELIKSDPVAAEALFKDALRIRMGLRDLNERTARQIAGLLPGAAGTKLLEEIDTQDAETVNFTTRGQTLIEEALKLEDLTPKEKGGLEELKAWYDGQLLSWRKQMRETNRKHEEEQIPFSLSSALGREKRDESDYYAQWKLPEGHPVQKLRMQRYEMDKEARKKLKVILGEDLLAKLPVGRQDYAKFDDRRPGGL
jgi:hypothetical protein